VSRFRALVTAQQHDGGKGKGKVLGTCYSAAYMSRLEQQRFTVWEVAADWHELMTPWRIMRPSIVHENDRKNSESANLRQAAILNFVENYFWYLSDCHIILAKMSYTTAEILRPKIFSTADSTLNFDLDPSKFSSKIWHR